MHAHRQAGASGIIIAVVLILIMVALLAARVLSRLGDSAQDRSNTMASLVRAQAALDQYVAAGGANGRLPCPADPGIDETASPASAQMGLERPSSAIDCTFSTGTLPWRTLGLRMDDAYDAWGRKLSYRVYTGNKGSLVQAGGPSMVNCYDDGTNAAGSGTTAAGLCNTDHSTSRLDFVSNGKGLKLTDMGTDHTPANNDPTAYVVISHGPTGYGGYTASGAQLTNPGGDERDNMKDTGPFHIEAWSDPDTAATSNAHFDDLLAYRTIADLATKANLLPRNWPLSSLTFDATTVASAFHIGTATSGSTSSGTGAVDFGAVSAQGLFGSSHINLVFDVDSATGLGGLGVGLPLFGNGISSQFGESVQFDYSPNKLRTFAITLIGFSTRTVGSDVFTDQVQFSFSDGNSPVTTVQKGACGGNPGLETFVIAAPANFTSVQVKPLSATSPTASPGDTSFTVAGIAGCRAGATCTTGIPGAVSCP